MRFTTLMIGIAALLISGCSMKTNLEYAGGDFNISKTTKGKQVHFSVHDERSDTKTVHTGSNSPLVLSRTPQEIIKEHFVKALAQKGLITNKTSATKLELHLENFRVGWNAGINVPVTADIAFTMQIITQKNRLLMEKTFSEKVTKHAWGGGPPATPKAELALMEALKSVIEKALNDHDTNSSLLDDNNSLPDGYISRYPLNANSYNQVTKHTNKESSSGGYYTDDQKQRSPPPLNIIIPKSKTTQSNSSIAVIIGNRNYSENGKNVPDVDYSHNDADLMKRYVIHGLGYREGNVIDLRDATQADLVSVFGNDKTHKGQLHSWMRLNKSDVFVFYSGHGAPGLSNGQGYLLPVDANPNTVELNGYPLETLYANLGKLPAKSLTVVVDACFSGSSQAGSVVKNASAISLKRVNVKNTLPHATILTAAGISEVASWDEEARLGLFTRHFLEGVTGKADQSNFGNDDGQVTLGEMKSYLESEVTYMARRLYMREQHPQISGNLNSLLANSKP